MNPLHFGIDLGDIRIWINLGSNAIPLLIETAKVQRVTCTWSWPRYTLSECSLVSIIIIIIIIIIMRLTNYSEGRIYNRPCRDVGW